LPRSHRRCHGSVDTVRVPYWLLPLFFYHFYHDYFHHYYRCTRTSSYIEESHVPETPRYLPFTVYTFVATKLSRYHTLHPVGQLSIVSAALSLALLITQCTSTYQIMYQYYTSISHIMYQYCPILTQCTSINQIMYQLHNSYRFATTRSSILAFVGARCQGADSKHDG
jgi:hypothetical protein